MQADFAVELGADDPVLEVPWFSESAAVRYFDLKGCPDLVDNIPEARDNSELAAFLGRVNTATFPLLTAKCDTWFSHEISAEEEIFGATCKFCSYVDLLFVADSSRTSFAEHESFVGKLCNLLQHVPEMAATIELVIRRSLYHPAGTLSQTSAADLESDGNNSVLSHTDAPMNGFYITAYVHGFGDTKEDARKHWSIALRLLQHALVQLSND